MRALSLGIVYAKITAKALASADSRIAHSHVLGLILLMGLATFKCAPSEGANNAQRDQVGNKEHKEDRLRTYAVFHVSVRKTCNGDTNQVDDVLR
jgi:hypothetical protein